jgi:hypothetical protein
MGRKGPRFDSSAVTYICRLPNAVYVTARELAAVRPKGSKGKPMINRLIYLTAIFLVPMAVASVVVDLPELQEGLWERHTQSVEMPGDKKMDITSKICRDHAYDKSVIETNTPSEKSCTLKFDNLGAGRYAAESRCTMGNTVVETKQTFIYQGTSVHSENQVTYTPALGGLTGQRVVIDEKYVGSCPKGMKPGDESAPTIK